MKLARDDFLPLLVTSDTPSSWRSLSVDLLVDGVPYRRVVIVAYYARGARGLATSNP
jgi:hypothetical protein